VINASPLYVYTHNSIRVLRPWRRVCVGVRRRQSFVFKSPTQIFFFRTSRFVRFFFCSKLLYTYICVYYTSGVSTSRARIADVIRLRRHNKTRSHLAFAAVPPPRPDYGVCVCVCVLMRYISSGFSSSAIVSGEVVESACERDWTMKRKRERTCKVCVRHPEGIFGTNVRAIASFFSFFFLLSTSHATRQPRDVMCVSALDEVPLERGRRTATTLHTLTCIKYNKIILYMMYTRYYYYYYFFFI